MKQLNLSLWENDYSENSYEQQIKEYNAKILFEVFNEFSSRPQLLQAVKNKRNFQIFFMNNTSDENLRNKIKKSLA